MIQGRGPAAAAAGGRRRRSWRVAGRELEEEWAVVAAQEAAALYYAGPEALEPQYDDDQAVITRGVTTMRRTPMIR